jgi:hypothetical protein
MGSDDGSTEHALVAARVGSALVAARMGSALLRQAARFSRGDC